MGKTGGVYRKLLGVASELLYLWVLHWEYISLEGSDTILPPPIGGTFGIENYSVIE